jgi:hypothetical protein
MYKTSDWIKAVSRLSRLTVEGTLKWAPVELESLELPEPDDRPGRAFITESKDKRYRVSEVRRRTYTDEDSFYWSTEYFLEIFERKNPIGFFEFITRSPSLPAIVNLWRTIDRKYAYQRGALDDLLGGDDDSDGEEAEQ